MSPLAGEAKESRYNAPNMPALDCDNSCREGSFQAGSLRASPAHASWQGKAQLHLADGRLTHLPSMVAALVRGSDSTTCPPLNTSKLHPLGGGPAQGGASSASLLVGPAPADGLAGLSVGGGGMSAESFFCFCWRLDGTIDTPEAAGWAAAATVVGPPSERQEPAMVPGLADVVTVRHAHLFWQGLQVRLTGPMTM